MTLGEKIKTLRFGRGMSSGELAEVSGLCRNTVSNVENGGTKLPRAHVVKKLAEGLGVKVSELFDFEAPADIIPFESAAGCDPAVLTPVNFDGVDFVDLQDVESGEMYEAAILHLKPDCVEDVEPIHLALNRLNVKSLYRQLHKVLG